MFNSSIEEELKKVKQWGKYRIIFDRVEKRITKCDAVEDLKEEGRESRCNQ